MAQGPKYSLPFRRRREGRTNYALRLGLLKSDNMRLVVRKSLKHMSVQVVKYNPKGDEVIASANSKELAKYGWGISTSNLSAAYLTGLLCGMKSKKKDVKIVNPDIGLRTPIWGTKVFSAMNGFSDAGIEMTCDKGVFPSPERVSGKHIADYAQLLKKDNPEKYTKQFSAYIKAGVAPEDITSVFKQAKEKILSEGGKL